MTTLQQQIQEADTTFAEAFNSGDLDSLLTYHEDGALLIPPGAPLGRGDRNVAVSAVKEMYAQGFRNMRSESIEFGSDGDLAYHVGRTTADLTENGTTQPVTWTFVDIYRRNSDGDWKIHVSTWNEDGEA